MTNIYSVLQLREANNKHKKSHRLDFVLDTTQFHNFHIFSRRYQYNRYNGWMGGLENWGDNIHKTFTIYKTCIIQCWFFFTYDFNFELIEIENVLLDIAPKTAHNQHNN